MNYRRACACLTAGAALVTLSGCAGAPAKVASSTVSSSVSASASTSTSATATPSVASPTPTPTVSSPPPTYPAGLIPISGYTYADLPADLAHAVERYKTMGIASRVVGRVFVDSSGNEPVALLLVQYTHALTSALDKMSPATILDRAIPTSQVLLSQLTRAKASVSAHMIAGVNTRLIKTSKVSMLIAYKKGGQVIELLDANPDELLRIAEAYLLANH